MLRFAAHANVRALGLVAFALSFLVTQGAVACRGIRDWPRNEHDPRLKAEHVVVRATLLRAYESHGRHRSIMGSDRDFIYTIKVDGVLKSSADASIRPGDYLYVENPGFVCEFYRPWKSSKELDVSSEPSKTIVLRFERYHGDLWSAWRVIGGE
jgi:hypothetical protein